ncbi:MAG: hypothetical protein HYX66_05670 [Ignavibacteria bacterium]|nr:hypothetical protein [Ignavibacteria bacterium]
MSEPFSSADVTRKLFRKKWIILIISFVSAVAAYIISLQLPVYYKASINCVPSREDNSLIPTSGGGIGAALKDFGLTQLGGSGENSYNFIVVLFTRTIRDSMINRFNLAEEYEIDRKKMSLVRSEFESNLEVEYKPEGNYEITIWSRDKDRAVQMCSEFVRYANDIANRIKQADAIKTTKYLQARIKSIDSLYAILSDTLVYYSKTYKIFSPLDQSKATATALASAKSDLLKQEAILGILERSYGAADPQVGVQRELVKNLQRQYDDLIAKPGMSGDVSLSQMTGISAHYMKISAELEGLAKLKAFLLPTLEQMQLDINRTAPALLVVDQPIPADKKDRPKRLLIASGTFFGMGILSILFFLLLQAWKSFK